MNAAVFPLIIFALSKSSTDTDLSAFFPLLFALLCICGIRSITHSK